MKKLLFICPFLFLFSLSFFSGCTFSDDDDLLDAPSVTSTKNINSIYISHERLSSSNERVNIERIVATNSKAKPTLIATLYPKNITSPILTYPDRFIYEGTKYKYRFIFIDSETKKYYTKWSDAVKAQEGFTEANTPYMTYNVPGEVFLKYDTDDDKLILSGGSIPELNNGNTDPIPNLSDDFTPALVLKAGDSTIAFDLTEDNLSTQDSTFFSLRQQLPLTFYDKPIYCLGLTGKNPVTEKSSDIIRIEWTELVPLKIVYAQSESEEVKYLKINSSSSTGVPY